MWLTRFALLLLGIALALFVCAAIGIGMEDAYRNRTPRVHAANIALTVLALSSLTFALRLWWLPRPPFKLGLRLALSAGAVIGALWCIAAAAFWALFVG
jgi:hypothetical protein